MPMIEHTRPMEASSRRREHERGARVALCGPGHQIRERYTGHRRCNRDRCDHGTAVGFEDVGTHTGNVAHVVTDVVGDHAGVARVVLGNAGLNLTDQVGTHIRTLGVDAAADA